MLVSMIWVPSARSFGLLVLFRLESSWRVELWVMASNIVSTFPTVAPMRVMASTAPLLEDWMPSP